MEPTPLLVLRSDSLGSLVTKTCSSSTWVAEVPPPTDAGLAPYQTKRSTRWMESRVATTVSVISYVSCLMRHRLALGARPGFSHLCRYSANVSLG